jgi:iron complex transport system ATP-binding protein
VLTEDALGDRFAAARESLGRAVDQDPESVDRRIAVSAVQVSLVSRLWSVALGSAVLHGWVPDLHTDLLVCGTGHRSPVPMASTDPARGRSVAGPEETSRAVAELVVSTSLKAVNRACAEHGRTSERVLLSNTASALVGAGRVLTRHRPEAAATVGATVRLLLEEPVPAAGGGYVDGEFKRRGCCLYYRLPGHGLCPDCVLVRPGHPADDHH